MDILADWTAIRWNILRGKVCLDGAITPEVNLITCTANAGSRFVNDGAVEMGLLTSLRIWDHVQPLIIPLNEKMGTAIMSPKIAFGPRTWNKLEIRGATVTLRSTTKLFACPRGPNVLECLVSNFVIVLSIGLLSERLQPPTIREVLKGY